VPGPLPSAGGVAEICLVDVRDDRLIAALGVEDDRVGCDSRAALQRAPRCARARRA